MAPHPPEETLDTALADLLQKLAAGDDSARAKLLEICDGRLRHLAHRLLGKFARVRRWDDTDDVAQGAAVRLYRALGETVPDSTRGLMGLIATVIQRELIDLARKHSGPMSYATNHDTNVRATAGDGKLIIEEAADDREEKQELPIERWEAFHKAVDSLQEEHRDVFKLVWYLGLDQKAVADTLGMSQSTVGRRWREAREMIHARLGDE